MLGPQLEQKQEGSHAPVNRNGLFAFGSPTNVQQENTSYLTFFGTESASLTEGLNKACDNFNNNQNQNDLEGLKTELTETRRKLEEEEGEMESLQARLAQTQKQLEEKITQLTDCHETQMTALQDQHQQTINKKADEVKGLKAKVDKAQQQKEEIEQQLEDFQKQLETQEQTSAQQKEELSTTKAELERIQNTLEEKEQQINQIKSEFTEQSKKLESEKQEKEKQKQYANESQVELIKVQTESKQDSQNKDREIDELKKKVEDNYNPLDELDGGKGEKQNLPEEKVGTQGKPSGPSTQAGNHLKVYKKRALQYRVASQTIMIC